MLVRIRKLPSSKLDLSTLVWIRKLPSPKLESLKLDLIRQLPSFLHHLSLTAEIHIPLIVKRDNEFSLLVISEL